MSPTIWVVIAILACALVIGGVVGGVRRARRSRGELAPSAEPSTIPAPAP
ncbi:hypothetical protein HMPREF0682_0081, partial [Propionibacterium acidifaciens F0233]